MMNKKINELKVGEDSQGIFLIKSVAIKTSSNKKSFLDMTLVDKTGEINGKLWDCTQEDEEKYVENQLIKVRGNITEWQGRVQIRIDRIRLITEKDQITIEDFVPSAPYKAEIMYQEVLNYIEKIQNEDMHNIVFQMIEEVKDRLFIYPAAKQNHHAVRSGLLYHIMNMLKTAEKLCEVYTSINKDLLFSGIILHDIAKIDEMAASSLGIVSDYTVEGHLLGHIIQGIKKIDAISKKVNANQEISMLLQHMVLSHHYEPEFGSPKKPMIPEAELLHYIDLIDARMYDMTKVLSNTVPGQFSEKVWVLENRKLYQTTFDKEESNER
ncbi:HD domain-containing protein [Clostridiaceae bacterium 35-E11]